MRNPYQLSYLYNCKHSSNEPWLTKLNGHVLQFAGLFTQYRPRDSFMTSAAKKVYYAPPYLFTFSMAFKNPASERVIRAARTQS